MLTHFSALLIFAACLSVVFGITLRAVPRLMIRFGIFTFGACVLGAIAASWAMSFIKH